MKVRFLLSQLKKNMKEEEGNLSAKMEALNIDLSQKGSHPMNSE